MPFHLQTCKFDEVRAEVMAVLDATRSFEVDVQRFQWMYQQNPDGEAVIWMARCSDSEQVAGFAAVLPRRMLVNGDEKLCWNCADLSVLPAFRRQGLAALMRSAARDGVDQGIVDFLYAHPNPRAAGAHRKVGHSPVGQMIRYAKLLRAAPYLKRKVHSDALATVGGAFIDPFLRIADAAQRHQAKCDISVLESPHFETHFDRLFERKAPQSGIIGIRDSRYLKWRYQENPVEAAHVILAEQAGALAGYLVICRQSETAAIKDLFPMDDAETARDLLSAAGQWARERELASLSFTLLDSNPLIPLLTEFGYRPRGDISEMFAYASRSREIRKSVVDGRSWLLTVGDRDV